MDLHTGSPFWPARDGLIASYPSLASNLKADVVVIGAGITGALVTHELTALGASVITVDKRDVASGSTAASSGLLMYETDTELQELCGRLGERQAVRTWRMGQEAIDAIEALVGGDTGSCGFARRDALYIASSRWKLKVLQREFEQRRRCQFDVEWLTASDLRRSYGPARAGRDP